MKALVAGWFSFEQMGATAGDLLARDIACDWLKQAGCSYDIALTAPFSGGVDWRSVDPEEYAYVIFVCGPFGNGSPVTEFLARFEDCRLIGLNLSMLEPLETWNPFDLLLERDSSRASHPEMAFLSRQPQVPVVGLILIDTQPEYGTRDMHQAANDAIQKLIDSRELSVVRIDTRLDVNSTGLRTPAEVESLIARMDVVLTTRLHGTVLALKNGVPAVAIDSVSGGAKIQRQAETIGWPIIFTMDTLTEEGLQKAFDYCLTEDARLEARKCRDRAVEVLERMRDQFIATLARWNKETNR